MANKISASTSMTLSPEQGLSRYLTEIRKFPMLEKNEEFMLARRWREQEDGGQGDFWGISRKKAPRLERGGAG